MPTPTYALRIPDDLRELAETRARREHLDLSALVRSALRAYLTGDDGSEDRYRLVLTRAAAAEAELKRLRDDLAAARRGIIRTREADVGEAADAARQARADLLADQEDRLAVALISATRQDPATAPRLAALSGFSRYWCRDLARALTETGYAEKAGPGQWIAVPGKDVREGITTAKRLAQHGAALIAPHKREPRDGSIAAPVPAEPAAEATEPAEAIPAPGQEEPERGGTATKLRTGPGKAPLVAADRRKPVTTEHREQADAIAPGTALFQQPGTERVVTQPAPVLAPSCPPHPKRRVAKGLCGACGRNVGFEKLA